MSRRVLAIAQLDDADRFRRRQNMIMAASRVVAMAVRNNRLIDGERGVDKGVYRLYI